MPAKLWIFLKHAIMLHINYQNTSHECDLSIMITSKTPAIWRVSIIFHFWMRKLKRPSKAHVSAEKGACPMHVHCLATWRKLGRDSVRQFDATNNPEHWSWPSCIIFFIVTSKHCHLIYSARPLIISSFKSNKYILAIQICNYFLTQSCLKYLQVFAWPSTLLKITSGAIIN